MSLSFFSFLFSEIVQQLMRKQKEADQLRRTLDDASAMPIPDVEQELHLLGLPVG